MVAAEGEGLLDLLVQLLAGEDVGVRVVRLAVEGAEVADRGTDVRVVDVAVDVVRAVRLRVQPRGDRVGGPAESVQVVAGEQLDPLVRGEPLAVNGFRQDSRNRRTQGPPLPGPARGRGPARRTGTARPAPAGRGRSSRCCPGSAGKSPGLGPASPLHAGRLGRPSPGRGRDSCAAPDRRLAGPSRPGPPRPRTRTAGRSTRTTPGPGRTHARSPAGTRAWPGRRSTGPRSSACRRPRPPSGAGWLAVAARVASRGGCESARRWCVSLRRGQRTGCPATAPG